MILRIEENLSHLHESIQLASILKIVKILWINIYVIVKCLMWSMIFVLFSLITCDKLNHKIVLQKCEIKQFGHINMTHLLSIQAFYLGHVLLCEQSSIFVAMHWPILIFYLVPRSIFSQYATPVAMLPSKPIFCHPTRFAFSRCA